MQIDYEEDNLHEMSKPIFWEKYKKDISKCQLKVLPNMQCVSQLSFAQFYIISSWYCNLTPMYMYCISSRNHTYIILTPPTPTP